MFVGTLPSDFLRVSNDTTQQQQEAADQQAALALHQQMVGMSFTQNTTGRLSITIGQVCLQVSVNLVQLHPHIYCICEMVSVTYLRRNINTITQDMQYKFLEVASSSFRKHRGCYY